MNTINSTCIYDLSFKWKSRKSFEIGLYNLKFITNAFKSYRANDVKLRILVVIATFS